MDNQKEIQKMQQEIFDSCAWRFSRHPEDYREVANDIGEDLYNLGYRNCKDKVVLTREEYAELAQKIYDDIFAILKIKLWLYGDDAMTKNLNGLSKQKILDFSKKWGIEDNHLNEKDYSHIDHLQAHDKQIKDQARKETAREFAEKLKSMLFDLGNIVNEEDIDELLKEFNNENK